MVFPPLQLMQSQGHYFRASQTASEQQSDYGCISLATQSAGRDGIQQTLSRSLLSQFPILLPSRLTPLTRRIPIANSGLKQPRSAASSASRRIAERWRLIVAADRERPSRNERYRTMTDRSKQCRGSEQYHSMNFSMACLEALQEWADASASSTVVFDCSNSGRVRLAHRTGKVAWLCHGLT